MSCYTTKPLIKEAIENMFTAVTSWQSNSNCNHSNKGKCRFLATTILSLLRSGKFCTKDDVSKPMRLLKSRDQANLRIKKWVRVTTSWHAQESGYISNKGRYGLAICQHSNCQNFNHCSYKCVSSTAYSKQVSSRTFKFMVNIFSKNVISEYPSRTIMLYQWKGCVRELQFKMEI